MIEIAVTGMRTRAMAVEDVAGEKRRKVGDGELKLIQITTEEEDDTRASSDHVGVSCCSSNESTEKIQFTDFEESVESRTRTHSRCISDTGASKLRTEIKAESGVRKIITAKPSPVISSIRTVPASELEEFFASAEKELHNRFKEKYNYDVVKDTPLEGRFEWVELEPKP